MAPVRSLRSTRVTPGISAIALAAATAFSFMVGIIITLKCYSVLSRSMPAANDCSEMIAANAISPPPASSAVRTCGVISPKYISGNAPTIAAVMVIPTRNLRIAGFLNTSNS